MLSLILWWAGISLELHDASPVERYESVSADHLISVIVDHPFVTGRSTADSYTTGQKLVEMLEKGLTRYGW